MIRSTSPPICSTTTFPLLEVRTHEASTWVGKSIILQPCNIPSLHLISKFPDIVHRDFDVFVDHSVPTIIPLGRFRIRLVQTHLQTAEEVGKCQVQFEPRDADEMSVFVPRKKGKEAWGPRT